MKVIIRGIRRSGLTYISNLLSCRMSRSEIQCEDGSEESLELGVHVARSPLDAIGSLRVLGDADWQKISKSFPQVKMTDSVLRRSMMLYYHGNRACRSNSTQTIQVEYLTPPIIRYVFDVDPDGLDLSEVPEDQQKITVWADLKREDIRASIAVSDLARSFGYETPIIESNSTCAGCV